MSHMIEIRCEVNKINYRTALEKGSCLSDFRNQLNEEHPSWNHKFIIFHQGGDILDDAWVFNDFTQLYICDKPEKQTLAEEVLWFEKVDDHYELYASNQKSNVNFQEINIIITLK